MNLIYISLIFILNFSFGQPTFLPLKKGQKWEYKVKYSNESKKNVMGTFTTEVLDLAYQGKYTVALVRNFPTEFYDLQHTGYKHLIVYDKNNYYIIPEDFHEWIDVIESNCCKGYKKGLSVNLPILPLFLKDKIFGFESKNEVPYKWFGELNKKTGCYEFSYMTNPDLTLITVKPQKGIISYKYRHHGSIDTKEINLIK